MQLSRRNLLALAGAGAAGAALDRVAAAGVHLPHGSNGGRLREHWLAVTSFRHVLAPSGVDEMMGMPVPPETCTYDALGFRAYTPGWGPVLPGDAEIGPNAGIPGPVIRAEVGDTVRIHLRNDDRHYGFPHSLHVHGLEYTPENDGSWSAVEGTKPGTALMPGESFTYEYRVPDDAVGTWVYHDHSQPQKLTKAGTAVAPTMDAEGDMAVNMRASKTMELNAELGLFGMLIVTDGDTPKVDREHCVFLHELYQANVPQLAHDFDCFNGRAYLGNTPVLRARPGERVRLRLAALGQEFHVFHVHGHRFQVRGENVDTVMLGPSTATSVEWTERSPGTWLYHCHVIDHMMGGMVGRYVVA